QGIDFIVEVPSASGAIDTDRILVRPTATQVAYLPDARWTAAAPVMLQSALVETFLRSNAFRYVGRRPLGVSGDVALVSDLVDFGAEVRGDGAVIEVTLVARLVRVERAPRRRGGLGPLDARHPRRDVLTPDRRPYGTHTGPIRFPYARFRGAVRRAGAFSACRRAAASA
ncbi:MAG: ABC-type transport auxiliary lipoprotein family protein, partial [Rhodobacteraceae bacterium]|nr:ABC-type transport auxiliary lipoprotein family protein [Paracoccaceae bacterium]